MSPVNAILDALQPAGIIALGLLVRLLLFVLILALLAVPIAAIEAVWRRIRRLRQRRDGTAFPAA